MIRRAIAEGIIIIFNERRVVHSVICHQTTELRRRTQEVAIMRLRCKPVKSWFASKQGEWNW